jgi:cytochrome c oxidase cbb3-type subunit 3/ubiquinol-cytochrome c reductase cytochrome c subunit
MVRACIAPWSHSHYAADHAPSLVNPTFLESASADFLRRSIIAGRPGTSMAAYGRLRGGPLDDAGVERVVAFWREQGPAARPLPAIRDGDVQTGAVIDEGINEWHRRGLPVVAAEGVAKLLAEASLREGTLR